MEEERFKLRIERLSLGGYGVGRIASGLVVFVPLAAPGELVQVKLLQKKKNMAFAQLEQIIEASPERVKPPCPQYGKCGGCNLQHISYPEQLRSKQSIVEYQLRTWITDKTQVFPIVASPKIWNYRNRIQIHYKNGTWGFRGRKSHEFISAKECHIAETEVLEKISRLNLEGEGRLQVACDGVGLDPGFSQVNRSQNELLVSTVVDWTLGFKNIPEIWDLYSGAGNFSFPLLKAHSKTPLVGVELSKFSVASATQRCAELGLGPNKIRFHLADVEIYLKRACLERGGIILLDPPRTGCSRLIMQRLAHSGFQKLLYVSCNPATLSRDLAWLFQATTAPLKLEKIQAFDMFPQTDHVETLVQLGVDENPC